MTSLHLTQPLQFLPVFKERIWGGRRLEKLFGKELPAEKRIGESWEIVDRPEAQSIVAAGRLRGQTLHELWTNHRAEIFGNVANAERFPLLIKLLDAEDKLSLQVHPPAQAAAELKGEPKTEFWYIAAAAPHAELWVGLKNDSSRERIESALDAGSVEEQVHRIPVRAGDAMFLPAGRMHAIGAGNVIVEIQENSDTTYRVFDWNRVDECGERRELHVEQSLRSIDFEDFEPTLIAPRGETLVRHNLFEVEKWQLTQPRVIENSDRFAIVVCLTGELECAGVSISPGNFILVPASFADAEVKPRARDTSMLLVALPPQ